ncbi:hypothetical protein [Roseofilum capinflatum]|uniref:Uncharacterized protein n=1 Tax=Roseofilum capinflatum BLCC-M114 TaxID=3022440 RepID=A0ABT7B717_9CYAN|nr:hypothetical protein [Roseofilum capinflatum]MDJ1174083.1 hypothetical protein [Roseofilum capinflatum BLCC-M114]
MTIPAIAPFIEHRKLGLQTRFLSWVGGDNATHSWGDRSPKRLAISFPSEIAIQWIDVQPQSNYPRTLC